MNLHEAMEKILKEVGCPMTAIDLAAEINRRNLYSQKNGAEVPPSQIYARRAKYQNRFGLDDGLISLLSCQQ